MAHRRRLLLLAYILMASVRDNSISSVGGLIRKPFFRCCWDYYAKTPLVRKLAKNVNVCKIFRTKATLR